VTDTTWTHLLARPMVRPLIGTPVRPNHLTTLRLLTGIAACVAFGLGTRAGMGWGGGLWLVSAFLDRADGELARLGNMMSAAGHRYDYLTDIWVNSLFFAGIGFGLRDSWLGLWSIPLGLWAAVSLLLTLTFVEWVERRSPKGTKLVGTKWGFDPDDAFYLLGPMAWLGWLSPILVVSSIVTTFTMVFIGLQFLRVRRGGPGNEHPVLVSTTAPTR
jgi:archaetidylinositol phosphate synthase